jgi:hypothetical protein
MPEHRDAGYDYPEDIDPAAESIIVQEICDGAVTQVVFPRLHCADLPPAIASKFVSGVCFGEIQSDTRQLFLHYDSAGRARALFAYRDGLWGWQPIGKDRSKRRFGLLLEFESDAMLRMFEQAALQAMWEGQSSVPLYMADLCNAPKRVPLTD